MRTLLLLVCCHLFLASCVTNTSRTNKTYPSYTGEVREIHDPISIKFQLHDPIKFHSELSFTAHLPSHRLQAIIDGEIIRRELSELYIENRKFLDFKMIPDNEKSPYGDEDTFNVKLDKSGKYLSPKSKYRNMDESFLLGIGFLPKFPDTISTGTNVSSYPINKIWKYSLPFSSLDQHAIVEGETIWKGKKAIVLTVSGTVNLKVGEQTLHLKKKGYVLVDPDTSQNLVENIVLKSQTRNMPLKIIWTHELNF